ncbi:MAG: membrane protein insertase YidC [Candidatus Binatus sp.]|uniref:membrane protein insertase YidC n=1 Tax=Candidatus Binatus sp. TaxID=2811406 RepID=UPI0027192714|nr:membrane protein insertase YidC [Candidatus Binatus sp.]MDO8432298.1 membrane protein insertase YidC [Candidatus Binatus sp.]
MDTSRVLIAVILSLAIVFAYQELVLKRIYPPPSQQAAEQAKAAKAAESRALANAPASKASSVAGPGAVSSTPAGSMTSAPGAVASSTAASGAQVKALASAATATSAEERTIEIDSDYWVALLTTRGARLKSFRLKRYQEKAAADSGWYEMVSMSPGGHLPLGVVMTRDGEVLGDQDLIYAASAGSSATAPKDRIDVTGAEAKVSFTAVTADGTKIEKTFTFHPSSYVFEMDVAVAGGPPLQQIGVSMSQPLTAHLGYYDIPELQADVKDKVLTQDEKNLRKGVEPVSGPITYAGFGDRYFLSVFLPQSPSVGTLAMAYAGDEAVARLLFPGANQVKTRVYMGPKLLDTLDAANPALHKAIDFGWAGILALVFLRTLKLFHLIAPNYGVDIILLTIALRIVFLPLSIKSQRSMMKMQRLQPQMERLREKYKDNNEQLQKEMVDLYKRNHVNPLGGCAPMALQLPIFIGLYEALLNSIELRHAPFIGWINDLSTPDCLHISWLPQLPMLQCHGLPVLVLLMGLSSFAQQYMTPTSPDPSQQRMMMLTPLIFTIMLINFPAGLSLYYFSSNMLGVIQQFFLNREFKQYSPAT